MTRKILSAGIAGAIALGAFAGASGAGAASAERAPACPGEFKILVSRLAAR